MPITKQARVSTTPRKRLTVVQKNFPKGVVTVLENARIPKEGLSDMTNIDIVQDSIARPRPSTIAYGPAALGTIIGVGTFTKVNAGTPERWQITMQVIAGVGQIVINKDGGNWTTIGGSYNASAWCQFTQANNRVYISNGINTMSYYDIASGTITTYTALSAPSTFTPSPSATLTTGTPSIKYYYAVTANNKVGETMAVTSGFITINKYRSSWVLGTDSVTMSIPAVTNATSYNWYISQYNGGAVDLSTFSFLVNTATPNFTDDGSANENAFKSAPPFDSTGGPKLTFMINADGQLFGVGDPDHPYYCWYSAAAPNTGDFSPFDGGGFTYVNNGGDSIPNVVKSFRSGKGDPLVTVLTKGQGGQGKLYHIQKNTTTFNNQAIDFYTSFEANGQSGTISPFGVVEANNSLYYPAGDSFKSTGSSPNVFNILATNSVSQAIDPSVRGLNISAMSKCVGLYYRDRIFWALPNGTSTNSEIWITDLARNGLWILRWTVPADWLWLYEDNSGVTHMCALVANTIVQFDFNYTVTTQDQGVAFKTRLATGALTWDDSGISMAAVQQQKFKLLYPKGNIQINNYGIGSDTPGQQTLGGSTYSVSVSPTGYGDWYFGDMHKYGDDVGYINYYSQATGVVTLEPDETLSEITAEIITTDPNCDYTLSTITTLATVIPNSFLGD